MIKFSLLKLNPTPYKLTKLSNGTVSGINLFKEKTYLSLITNVLIRHFQVHVVK